METESKRCKSCGVHKPVSQFDHEPRVKSKITARCKECVRASKKEWANKNIDRVKQSRQKYASKYPDRVQAARHFTNRREALERRERRLSEGLLAIEPRTTDNGRRCSSCRRRKLVTEFSCDAGHYDGISAYCKTCAAANTRKYLQKLSDGQREQRRIWYRKYDMRRLYGVPYEELLKRLEAQNGKCKICQEEVDLLVPKRNGRTACVDHEHTTGKIRGLLCVKCNAGLGQFRDSPDLLKNAVAYLTETE